MPWCVMQALSLTNESYLCLSIHVKHIIMITDNAVHLNNFLELFTFQTKMSIFYVMPHSLSSPHS